MDTAAIITVSDRCFAGERRDEGGPLLEALLRAKGYEIIHSALVPDDEECIIQAIRDCAEKHDAALILTTGGTGLSPRDVTPEATARLCERIVPGVGEAMRARSLAITERAMLSRGLCAIYKRSLILNLPGSPRAAEENFSAVAEAIEHGLLMLRGPQADCAQLQAEKKVK